MSGHLIISTDDKDLYNAICNRPLHLAGYEWHIQETKSSLTKEAFLYGVVSFLKVGPSAGADKP